MKTISKTMMINFCEFCGKYVKKQKAKAVFWEYGLFHYPCKDCLKKLKKKEKKEELNILGDNLNKIDKEY